MADFVAWLGEIGLERYAPALTAHEVDFDTLPHLSDADLQEIGLPLGPRRKLVAALAERMSAGHALASGGDSSGSPAITSKLDAERRHLTLMFADLVGSTALSSRFDPEEMRDVLRAYQDAVAGEIARLGGHVAKLMGDGVLAYFGWPRAHEDEAERAVRAGLAICEAVAQLEGPDGAPLACRIGIATGPVVVGDLIGHGAAQEQAVVGETPNLAARLQTLGGPGEVVVAEATRRLLGNRVVLKSLGSFELHGLPEPQTVYGALAVSHTESRFAARGGPGVLPLVGREEELGLLRRAWRQALAGEGHAVLVQGEAGIGKSRLVQALRDSFAAREAGTVVYQGSPFHNDTPLWPVHQQRLLAGAPALEEGDDGPELAAAERRNRLLQRIAGELIDFSRRRPLLVLVEDTHWLDPTTRELLQRLMMAIGEARILLLMTTRPGGDSAFAPSPLLTSLPLARLARSAAGELVSEVAAARSLPERVRREILARSDGVPLFIEELTKAVLELAQAGDTEVPATLHESLLARLDRAPAMKSVAQIAACIGRDFDHRLLARVSDLAEIELDRGLQGLVGAELLFCTGSGIDARYRFKHALVRDIAHQSLLRRRRQQLHERVARALEADGSARETPELLARHWAAAGNVTLASDLWLAAGQLAAQRSANLEAAEHLGQGLALLRQHPEVAGADDRQLSLLIAQGPALMATVGWSAQEVQDTYARAMALAASTGRLAALFPSLWGRWLVAHGGGQADLARSLLEQILELARSTNDPQIQLQAHHAGTSNLMTDGLIAGAEAHAAAAMALYRPDQHHQQALVYGGHDPAVCIRCIHAVGRLMQGHLGEAERMSLGALDLSRTVGHLPSVAHGHSYRAELCHIGNGTAEEIERNARAVLEIAVPRGMAHYVAWATLALGWCLARRGEHDAALGHMRDGMAALHGAKNFGSSGNRVGRFASATGQGCM